MTTIAANLQVVCERIAAACLKASRPVDSVRLLAVSKTRPPDALREAWAAGQRAFGESYVQEGLEKIAALQDLGIEWHFIGPVQSNKTRPIAEHFAWVHSVDRLKIAERLSAQRSVGLPPLNICLQVNVSGEATKGGCRIDEIESLARAIRSLPNLRLRGLMAIPEPTNDEAHQRAAFARLRIAFEALKHEGFALDTLSMGMSHDLEAAVLEGASIVRIGTAIFGNRSKLPVPDSPLATSS